MKIVFNTDQIYMHGGIEKVMSTKVNYWAQLPEVEVYIVTTEQQNHPPCYSLDQRVKLIDLGINYDRTKSYFTLENLKKSLQHYRRQKAILRKLQPDVIISPNFNFDHYWLPFIKGSSKLIKERHASRYYEVHQRKNSNLIGRLRFLINDWIESKYNHIVVLNKDEANYVHTNNAVVIANPVDSTEYRAQMQQKRVMAAGRIAPVKGFDHLIEAWKIVHDRYPDWQLDIYGSNYGTTQENLQHKIQELQLENSITFKGNVPDIREVMQHYSIYTLTSITECFPTVLLESLSVGLPVVSYDCPNGPRHIVKHAEDGILIENQNIHMFAEGLIKIIENESLRIEMSRKALINYQRFSLENVMKNWTRLLHL